jgi:broad specificity phosphatase PhoE
MSHKLVLLRHGLSVANQEQIVQGQLDYPLADEGRKQAQILAAYWKKREVAFDQVIASPLMRARQTAEIIAESLAVDLVFDEMWMELHLGSAQGVDYKTFRKRIVEKHLTSPYEPRFGDGESEWDLFLRAARAVQKIIRSSPGSYLVVSHGGILGAAIRSVLGLTPGGGRPLSPRIYFANTGYAVLEFEMETARWSIMKLNVTRHLAEDEDSL